MDAQSRPTLCNPMDCKLAGSSIHGVSQERILELVAISFLKGSSQTRDQTLASCVSCTSRQILYHRVSWKELVKGEVMPIQEKYYSAKVE